MASKFLDSIATIFNSHQSQSIVLTGNILDLFYNKTSDDYVPIINHLLKSWNTDEMRKGYMLLFYELNKEVQFCNKEDKELVKKAWIQLNTGKSENELAIQNIASPVRPTTTVAGMTSQVFDSAVEATAESSAKAFEFLKQLCLASRTVVEGKTLLQKNIIVVIEGADMLVPQGEISRLSEADRKRVTILRDWFSDPGFMNGNDSVILLTESRSSLNQEVSRLPQIMEVQIPAPDLEQRLNFINWFILKNQGTDKFCTNPEELASSTAGLSIVALMQMLKAVVYSKNLLNPTDVTAKVEEFLKAQLGEVVEFYKPNHKMDSVIGNTKLKEFLIKKFIPRIKSRKRCISGATVCGAIGSGKTFIFEAVAAELGIPVLVLKNLRSKWFGETDILFERLRRCLEALDKVLIFVDEADTQFGGVGEDVHETERRLTGKVQQMMSDPRLKGKVVWLLMTARINQLSPDIRRPGRAGTFIILVLDPEGDDLKQFLNWVLEKVKKEPSNEFVEKLLEKTKGYYADAFNVLRDDLIFATEIAGSELSEEEILEVIDDRILQSGGKTRTIQILHGKINCSHRSLLPEVEDLEEAQDSWAEEIVRLGGKLN